MLLTDTIALFILLVSVIRVNRMIRRDYPKLKLRQVSSLVHITVGVLYLLASVLVLLFWIRQKPGSTAFFTFKNLTVMCYDLLTAWIIY